ncbi:MAG TPA: ATP-binding protein [Streptosporangiaceae bacterium]|nr:ATP-binding protein [Streptosporangiaceae bacterium]
MLSDSSLRTRVVYDIAVRYATPLWRIGAAFRGGCVAGLWILLAWFPARSLPQAAAQLLMVSAGVAAAWIQTQPDTLDRLASGRIAALRKAAGHLQGVRGRATADLAGLLEGFGMIVALLLYGGPIAVRPLPTPVYVAGLILITAHVWNAFAQVMTDASWYNPDMPPAAGLVAFRPWIPATVAAIEIAEIVAPGHSAASRLPAGLVIPLILAGSIVLLLPFTMVFEVLLRAGLEACEISMGEVRRNDSITVHSLVKNGAHALIRQIQADAGADRETRSLADSMLILAEEARQMMLGGGPPAETVALLWDCVLQTVPGDRRGGMILDAGSRELQMRKTDYGLARRVLPDLVTNAWKAGARRVEVAVTQERQHANPAARPWVTVSVADDGPGLPAQPAVTRTSLRILDDHLHRFDGAVVAERRDGGGTRVLARWRSAPW